MQLIEESDNQDESESEIESNMPNLIESENEEVVDEIIESDHERQRPLVELGPGAPVCPG